MWVKEFYGLNMLFDIRRTLLGLIPLVIYIIGEIVVYKRRRGKPWIRLAVVFSYIGIGVMLAKKLPVSILMDIVFLMIIWGIWILFKTLTGQTWTKREVMCIFLDSLTYIFFLAFISFMYSGPVSYQNNIVPLPPEIETTVYCINTGEYVSEDVIPEDKSVYLEEIYDDEEEKGFIYSDCVVIEGEYDYLMKTVSHYYIEDRNVKPSVREFSKTTTSYVLYIGMDGIFYGDE